MAHFKKFLLEWFKNILIFMNDKNVESISQVFKINLIRLIVDLITMVKSN